MIIPENGKPSIISDDRAMFPALVYVILTIFGMVLIWVVLGPLFDTIYEICHEMDGLISLPSLNDIDSVYYWYSISLFFGILGCGIWYVKQCVDKSKGF